ncbi:MAG: dTDP-4-dehydrorhamnose 3,5-epimerase family protein [bacterium]|nr:dTDP-4-dehydrorhamnose 3,5-epimerase family protein [bacterium]
MASIEESGIIEGVHLVSLVAHGDERGRFVESFRKEWFPQRDWAKVQGNASYSAAGVLRGFHYHHRQVDYWFVPVGMVRVGLFDMRPSSPTFRATQTLEIGEQNRVGVFIPVGVAHGFLALTDVVLTYLVDNYYDGTDENGLAWNDPEVGLDWGTTSPNLSPKDAANPVWKEIPGENLPK